MQQQQWEYLGVRLIPNGDSGGIIVLDPQNLKGTPLNNLGRQGWEVVGVFRDNFWVLLKRPVAASIAPAALADMESAPPVAPAPAAQAQSSQAGAPPTALEPAGGSVDPSDNPLMPHFGVPDEDRARILEQRLQGELQRRQSGGGPRSGRR